VNQKYLITGSIKDIFFFSARPQYNVQAFSLLTTYPSQELKDDDVTLKDASLLGATIMQRLK
jgi:UBX domain-containing protein 1